MVREQFVEAIAECDEFPGQGGFNPLRKQLRVKGAPAYLVFDWRW